MPAKLYGQLVGGPVQALNSGLIGIVPPHCKDSVDLILTRDYATTNGNVIGDQISLGSFKSTAFVALDQNSGVLSDALGAGVTGNIGDATHPSALVSGVNLATAAWRGVSGNLTAAQIAAPLWRRLGWSADPGGLIELLLTFAGANPANGSVAWQLCGRNM